MATDIPIGGTVRARVDFEITGETSKTYYISVAYGTLDTATGNFSVAFTTNTSITGAQQTSFVNLDAVVLGGMPNQMLDAIVSISDGVDANGLPTGTIYDQLAQDDPIRLYLPYGANIIAVSFSSV